MGHVAVVLAGCGHLDGSEIHESVLCLLCLERAGHTWQCFAPNKSQTKVIDHLSGQDVPNETRNTLLESARIARGKIGSLSELKSADFDAILMPGGYGAALNLSDWATQGENCTVDSDLKRVVLEFYQENKGIGATCITPAVLAKIFEGVASITLTLGQGAPNQSLTNLGMKAKEADVATCICDRENRVYTTPCYMGKPDLSQMFEGVTKLVGELIPTQP